jgi:hypothetical protein
VFDGCEDCISGIQDTDNDGDDYESDGLCDLGDPDDDNDGSTDDKDDCSQGKINVGADYDQDGCQDGDADFDEDLDEDGDGVLDVEDPIQWSYPPTYPGYFCADPATDLTSVCVTLDFDGDGRLDGSNNNTGSGDDWACVSSEDECSYVGRHNDILGQKAEWDEEDMPECDGIGGDGTIYCCVTENCEDADDDGDGSPDYRDNDDTDGFVCSDLDGDGCNDCSYGIFDVNNDGEDRDGDGLCDSGPLAHSYNQSSFQAFYYVDDIQDIYGEPLTSADWVLAFAGDSTCVGMSRWNSNGGNAVPVMGDDGHEYSDGYLGVGDEPIFKIYDESEQEYFNLHPSEHHGFEIYEIFMIESMTVSMDYEIDLHFYFNLISFYGLPDDNGISEVLNDLSSVDNVQTDGESAIYSPNVNWVGALKEFDLTSGYWLRISSLDGDTLKYL